jgi:hypothetical protein
MNELFLSILVFACGDFTGAEKAICTQDMIRCRDEVIRQTPRPMQREQLIKRCLEGVYLEYYLETNTGL